MLRISFRTEPFWLDLPHGVRLQLRPPGTAVILAAGAELAAARASGHAGDEGRGDRPGPNSESGPSSITPDATPRPAMADDLARDPAADLAPNSSADTGRLAFTCAVARAAILAWEGVADATGAPLPVSPAAVDGLMAHWPVFAAFERIYLQPALLVVAEGNG
jgi:hypothetical protein